MKIDNNESSKYLSINLKTMGFMKWMMACSYGLSYFDLSVKNMRRYYDKLI